MTNPPSPFVGSQLGSHFSAARKLNGPLRAVYQDLRSALGGTRIPNVLIRSSARGTFPLSPGHDNSLPIVSSTRDFIRTDTSAGNRPSPPFSGLAELWFSRRFSRTGVFSARSPSLCKISRRGKHRREMAPTSSLSVAEGRKIYRDVVAQFAFPPVPVGIHAPLEGGELLRRRRPLSTPQHVVSRLVEVQVPGLERIRLVAKRGGRRGRAQTRVATGGLIWTTSRHATTRAGDPQVHVLVANAVYMRDARGGWKGADTAFLRDHLHAATAAGRMAAAAKAIELGYAIVADPGPSGRLGGWAIGGIPAEVCELHSTRSAQTKRSSGSVSCVAPRLSSASS